MAVHSSVRLFVQKNLSPEPNEDTCTKRATMRVPLAAGLAAYLLHGNPQVTYVSFPVNSIASCAAFCWSLGILMPTAVGAFTPVNVHKIPAAHHDVRNGAIDTDAVVSKDGDGDGEHGDDNDKKEDVTDIDAMIDAMLPEAVALSSKEEGDDDDDNDEVDDDDKDDVPEEFSSAELPAKVSASASAAALREASERRQAAETKRAQALENAAAKEEDRQLAALNEQRLAAAAAAAIEEERKRQAAIVEERREAKRRAVEEETQRAIREQSLSQAEKNQRFRREAAAAFGDKEDVLFSSNQQSRREELSRVEANRRADAALPVEVMGASGVASEERRLEEDVPYPPMRPPRPCGYATDDDRSPGFVGFSNARAQYPQKSKWVQQLQAEMLGKPPPMEYGEEAQGYVPPPYADDYQPINIGARASDGGRGMPTSPAIPPKEEDKKKPKGNRVLTPRAPDTSSSSSSPASTTSTPVNLDRFGDSWFQEQLKASKDEQSGEVHWYEGRRRQMKREEQERRERREAMEAAMERERVERLEREAREAEADESESKAKATASTASTNVEEDTHADKEQERKQRERMAAVLEVDEVRAELEKEREAIRAELGKKRAEASAAREAKLERERVAQEAAARAVEEQIRAAEEEIAEVEEKVQESAPPIASDAAKDDSTEEDADKESTFDTDDDEAGKIYNTYKAETIERRLASLQKDIAKSSEMVEEMSVEVADLKEEHAHASKMLRRAQDRKNDHLIRIRTDESAYAKAQLLDMTQELDILKRELACKEELLIIYQKRSDMLKREEWTEGRGPIKSPLTEWDHREEKEW